MVLFNRASRPKFNLTHLREKYHIYDTYCYANFKIVYI